MTATTDATSGSVLSPVEVLGHSSGRDVAAPTLSTTALRNIRFMHVLERVAERCEAAQIPIMGRPSS